MLASSIKKNPGQDLHHEFIVVVASEPGETAPAVSQKSCIYYRVEYLLRSFSPESSKAGLVSLRRIYILVSCLLQREATGSTTYSHIIDLHDGGSIVDVIDRISARIMSLCCEIVETSLPVGSVCSFLVYLLRLLADVCNQSPPDSLPTLNLLGVSAAC